MTSILRPYTVLILIHLSWTYSVSSVTCSRSIYKIPRQTYLAIFRIIMFLYVHTEAHVCVYIYIYIYNHPRHPCYPFCASHTKYSFWSLVTMFMSRIFPPFSDKIQDPLEQFNSSLAALMSSWMLCGTHNTTPSLLSSLGSHGWKGNTVHFFRRTSSVIASRNFVNLLK